jgi:signal transduction histidine kinase
MDRAASGKDGAGKYFSKALPAALVSLLVLCLLSGLILLISGSIARIADGKSFLIGLKRPWREIWELAEADMPVDERFSRLEASKASFSSLLRGERISNLARISRDFSTELERLKGMVTTFEAQATGVIALFPATRASDIEASFDRLSSILDGLTARQIGTFNSLYLFVLVLNVALCFGVALAFLRAGHLAERELAAQDFAAALIADAERERARLARELHDGIAQDIAYAKSEIERLSGLSPEVDLRGLREVLANSLASARSLCVDLRPPVLDGLGLVDALRSLCEAMQERHRLRVRFSAIGVRDTECEAERKALVARIAREALVNAARHSGSAEAELRLVASYPSLFLIVEDHGRGRQGSQEGLGMTGIKERARLLGGEAAWEDAAGGGTRMTLRIPMAGATAGGTA